ncbi:MAG: DUF1667 domain-containing protein [Eubacteriales bacterium]
MEKREITCIVCPVGCEMKATKDGDKIVVVGNGCKRGYTYAVDEMTNPKRMVTSSVVVKGGDMPLVSVKTSQPIPKEKIEEVLKEIKAIELKAPVKIGTPIIKSAAGTDVDIVATRNVFSVN